jgi:hypothetical protein
MDHDLKIDVLLVNEKNGFGTGPSYGSGPVLAYFFLLAVFLGEVSASALATTELTIWGATPT